jgi:LysR family transcriptional regulator, regulator for genes of the gallate degradation pathway
MTARLPNLRHLRAHCEIVAHGSISAAAKAVHLSQPAITKAIANLEASTGMTLFQRRRTGMVPTDAGLILARRAERALRHLRAGATEARALVPRAAPRGATKFDHLLTVAHLKALLAVADARSFSLAARRSGVSQPTLHKAARDLERLAGLPLFDKRPDGIALTQAAETFVRHVGLALAELRQAHEDLETRSARGSRGQGGGALLVVGTLPLVRTSILPRALNRFALTQPDTRFNVVDGSYDALLRLLRYGEIDMLIGALRTPPPVDDILQTELFRDRLTVLARHGHPLAGQRTVTRKMLSAYPWVVPREGPPTRSAFDDLFKAAHPEVYSGLIEASSLVLIRGLLMGSDRLTLVSRQQASLEIAQKTLVVLSFTVPDAARAIGLTTRMDWHPTRRKAEFIAHLKAECTGQRP